jgi:hypothetical protein
MRFQISHNLFLSGFLIWVTPLVPARGASIDFKVWEGSTDRASGERYVPVELWSGTEWDGKREIKMPQVDATYRHRSSYQIKGPVEWKHPVIGEAFLVYERINPGRDGIKSQLFTVNGEKSGLGRLYDARPGLGTRMFSGGLKFPIGIWKEGETRNFVYKVYKDSKESMRAEHITIKRLDFTFQGVPHCLEFYWAATVREGKKIEDHHTYIYCPGKSMVSEIQH